MEYVLDNTKDVRRDDAPRERDMAQDTWPDTSLTQTIDNIRLEGRKEMFYLTTHSTHFIYGYMASHIW